MDRAETLVALERMRAGIHFSLLPVIFLPPLIPHGPFFPMTNHVERCKMLYDSIGFKEMIIKNCQLCLVGERGPVDAFNGNISIIIKYRNVEHASLKLTHILYLREGRHRTEEPNVSVATSKMQVAGFVISSYKRRSFCEAYFLNCSFTSQRRQRWAVAMIAACHDFFF
jgi:hypothetical protein